MSFQKVSFGSYFPDKENWNSFTSAKIIRFRDGNDVNFPDLVTTTVRAVDDKEEIPLLYLKKKDIFITPLSLAAVCFGLHDGEKCLKLTYYCPHHDQAYQNFCDHIYEYAVYTKVEYTSQLKDYPRNITVIVASVD